MAAVAGVVPVIAANTQVLHILFRRLTNAFASKLQVKKYRRLNTGEETPQWKEKEPPLFVVIFLFEKEVLHMQDFRKLGDLDDVDSLPELTTMTETYIATPCPSISERAAVLMGGVSSRL